MPKALKSPKKVEVTTVRNNLKAVLFAVEKGERLIITRRGVDIAALVDPDELEDLEARTSPIFLKSIRQAKADIKAGRVYAHDEVFGKL